MRPSCIATLVLTLTVVMPAALWRADTSRAGQQSALRLAAPAGQQLAEAGPDRLVVTRTKNNLSNPNALPFSKIIANQALVAKLYADIVALPPFPAGPHNCPNDSGVTYHLDFYSGTASLLAGDYDPSGCAAIRLSNGTAKSAATGSLRTDLIQALGFSTDRQLLGLQ